ncbi:MAG: hypothetical protein H7Y00_01305 [Fimbriimonadaceae bacterium]|nr:hypothetical protein [Chitinophagales bacterium]
MKKFIIGVAIYFLLFIGGVLAQFAPDNIGFQYSEFEKYKKLKVKAQIEKVYDAEITQDYVVSSVTEFAKDGKILRTIYNPELHSEEAMDTVKYIYAYYPNGKILSMEVYGVDMYPLEFGYEYNNKDQLIKSNVASAEARKYSYEYDEKGNIKRSVGLGAFFEYDDVGEPIGDTQWVGMEEFKYTWNEKGLLVAETMMMQGEFYYHAEYFYNEKDQLVKQGYSYDVANQNTFSTDLAFTYDKNGLLIARVFSYPDTEEKYESIFEYTYYK